MRVEVLGAPRAAHAETQFAAPLLGSASIGGVSKSCESAREHDAGTGGRAEPENVPAADTTVFLLLDAREGILLGQRCEKFFLSHLSSSSSLDGSTRTSDKTNESVRLIAGVLSSLPCSAKDKHQ